MDKTVAASMPKRTFKIPASPSSFIDVNIAEPDLRAENLSLITWNSSFILASQLHKFDVTSKDNDQRSILELGAGTALVGIAAAILWRRKTVLTELPGIVPALRTNIDLNPAAIKATSGHIQCGSLDWRTPDLITLDSGDQLVASKDAKASIILAADTIYDEDHPQLLANTIFTWLSQTPDARVIFTYALRVAYLDHIREMWRLLEEGGLEAESDGQEQADTKDWDDESLCEWVVWKWKSA